MKPTEEHKADIGPALSGSEARLRPSEPQQPQNSVTPRPASNLSGFHSTSIPANPQRGSADQSRGQQPTRVQQPSRLLDVPPPLRRVGGPAQTELSRPERPGETVPASDEVVARLCAIMPGISNATIEEIVKVVSSGLLN